MSSITFQDREGEARLFGTERYWADFMCRSVTLGLIGGGDQDNRALRRLIPSDSYIYGVPQRPGIVETYLSGPDAALLIDGARVDMFTISLNTALILGGDPLRLLARMHGQCEIHGWVDGENRGWLASIVARGLASGLYRATHGWEEVEALLRGGAGSVVDLQPGESIDVARSSPVVMSYSITDSFPNADYLPPDHALRDLDAEARDEAFWALPGEAAWDLCIDGLRAGNPTLELSPANWERYHFGSGVNALTVFDALAQLRDGDAEGSPPREARGSGIRDQG